MRPCLSMKPAASLEPIAMPSIPRLRSESAPASAPTKEISPCARHIATGRVGIRKRKSFITRNEAALAFKTDDERHGLAGFFRGSDIVAVDEHRRLEFRIKRWDKI